MTPQELKNSILQRAIQGRLVEQRPEEGTGEELYREIQAEKQRLIRAGKIRKEKPLPEITEDEIPFDIPESWKWVRIGNVFTIIMGQSPDGAAVQDGGNGMEFHQGKIYFSDYKIQKSNKTTTQPLKVAPSNSVLLCVRAPVGKVNVTDRELCIGRGLSAITGHYRVSYKFIFYLFLTLEKEFVKKSTGTTFKAISAETINQQIIPLPPLAEQRRIVAKIEELLPYLDRYTEAWDRLETFNRRFPSDMRRSLLQLAIQGRLVEQRPEEGTGEELYREIQAEKQRLIRAGKIRKEKPLPEIKEKEIPFEIPESWKWCRIGCIFNLQAGKNITAADIYNSPSKSHPFLCYGGNGIRGYVDGYNRNGHYSIIGRQGALCGNINLAEGKFYATEHAVVVEHFDLTDVMWCSYFLSALNLNQYATATAQPGLAVTNIVKVLIPLPPLAEQRRIVARLEELLPLCERLE